ncbi:MAG: signal peptidase II, partial [Bacilli bacterium]|nr:signal peptidase II [Bacilli bacterium]
MNKKILTIISVVLFLDQVSKNLISSYIGFNKELIVIPNFFSLTNVNNYGAAWSILDNQTSLLIVITIIVLVVIYRYMNTFKENTRNIISFGLLFGGISGNLIDRLFLGY